MSIDLCMLALGYMWLSNFYMRTISTSHPFPHWLTDFLTHWLTNILLCFPSLISVAQMIHYTFLSPLILSIHVYGNLSCLCPALGGGWRSGQAAGKTQTSHLKRYLVINIILLFLFINWETSFKPKILISSHYFHHYHSHHFQ